MPDTESVATWLGWIEQRPLAVLVLACIAACWWLTRRVQALSRENRALVRALFRLEAGGADIGDDVTEIITRRDPRKEGRA